MPESILIVSSLDTKWREVKYLKELIEKKGQRTALLDLSMRGTSSLPAEISSQAVARAGGSTIEEVRTSSRRRDELTSIMIKGAIEKTLEMHRKGNLSGIIGGGGVSNPARGPEGMK